MLWNRHLGNPGYVNNRQIAHSRTAFRDDGARRHLMRFWNRDEGTSDLEGGGAVL